MDTTNAIEPRRRVERVVWSLGGSEKLGRTLSLHPTTVRKWVEKDRIPAQHQKSLLELAKVLGANITAEDLIG